MTFAQQTETARVWPAQAIHDTVAAIMRQPAYQRSLRTSMLERLTRWFGELLVGIIRTVGGAPVARRIAIAAAAVLVILVILRLAYASQIRKGPAPLRALAPARPGGSIDAWRLAEHLAAGGDYTGAAHALYNALIESLAVHGELRVHHSRTIGEYTRELRAHGSEAYAGFTAFRRRYERTMFRTFECDAESYTALLRDARLIVGEERLA